MKSSIGFEEAKSKIPAGDKTKLESAIDDTIKWLDKNPTAEKEDYEENRMLWKELPGAADGMPVGMPTGARGASAASSDPSSGPTIEEIDQIFLLGILNEAI